jgi:predicted phage terminase large subunit-like protein
MSQALTPKLTKYAPHKPTARQAAFLLLDDLEALYGGAAGGGKSDALLMAALQYVDAPHYAALILRRSYTDLSLPDAIMSRARDWLSAFPEVTWNESRKTFHFPSGATITFGYLESEADKYRYQGAAFQFIAFDELTQFTRSQYLYLFSRLRRGGSSDVPVRVRSASNPGGLGHEWVYDRFIPKKKFDGVIEMPVDNDGRPRRFVPARLRDNPHLDQDEYVRALGELDAVTRAQLLDGDWMVRQEGAIFKVGSFKVVDELPNHQFRQTRYWDLASTPNGGDWTTGVLMARDMITGLTYVRDVVRLQGSPAQVEAVIQSTAGRDGKSTPIRMEQEPGSSGVSLIDYYSRKVLYGYDYRGIRSTGSKVARAMGLAAQAERGNIYLLRANWNAQFLDELYAFPDGAHDDQVDAASGAFNGLAIGRDAHSSSSIGVSDATITKRGDLTLKGDRYVDKR